MHASRKLVWPTTTLIWLLLAGCSNSSPSSSDAGCTGTTCTGDSNCPTLTCTCEIVGFEDAGGEMPKTYMFMGECTSGCCAPCPPGCN